MGHSVTIAFMAVSGILSAILWWSMTRTNKKRKAGFEEGKIVGMTLEQVDDLGDESPRFLYAT